MSGLEAPPRAALPAAAAPAAASRKRKQSVERAAAQGSSASTRLHEACAFVLGRDLRPGDILYAFPQSGGEAEVAELSLPTLPGLPDGQTWVSGPCPNRREARRQAAEAALRRLAADFPALVAPAGAAPTAAAAGDPAGAAAGPSATAGAAVGAGVGAPLSEGGDVARAGPVDDAKTRVVVFCQWSCGRPMSRSDISYTTSHSGGQYTSEVTLGCLKGERFAGGPRPDRRQAEQSAAEEVLRAFSRERAVMARRAPKRPRLGPRQVQRAAAASSAAGATVGPEPDHAAKGRLHAACARLLGRAPQAGDVVYEVAPADGGQAATLRLPFLAQELRGQHAWTSEPYASRRDARARAAEMALEAVGRHPRVGPVLREQGSPVPRHSAL